MTEGIIYSFPCICKDGQWKIVEGLEVGEKQKGMMKVSEDELNEEKKLALGN